MIEGFIKLHRKMLEWEWADDPTVFYFFVKLLFLVNYKEKQWHNELIHRGQVVTSIAKLCDYTSLSRNAVMRCIEALKRTGEISETVQPNKYRVITVTNYNLYQDSVVPLKDNQRDNRKDNKRDNKRGNKKDNSRGTTKEKKEVSLSPTGIEIQQEEKNSAAPGVAESSTGLPAQSLRTQFRAERSMTSDTVEAAVFHYPTVKEMRTFAKTVPGSTDSMACAFLDGFELSGTRMPENWQEIYRRFASADPQTRLDFVMDMKAGKYKEKWKN